MYICICIICICIYLVLLLPTSTGGEGGGGSCVIVNLPAAPVPRARARARVAMSMSGGDTIRKIALCCRIRRYLCCEIFRRYHARAASAAASSLCWVFLSAAIAHRCRYFRVHARRRRCYFYLGYSASGQLYMSMPVLRSRGLLNQGDVFFSFQLTFFVPLSLGGWKLALSMSMR